MFIELAKGTALLLALSLLQSFIIRHWRQDQITGKLVSGLLFGGICVVGMLAPLNFSEGVIFDGRSVILSMAGLFGGPIVGVIAATIAGGYRLWIGGVGADIGVGVIVSCMLLGLAYRHLRKRGRIDTGILQLLVFGFIVHLASLSWFLLFPPEIAEKIFSSVAIPFVATFTLATPILGLLLLDVENKLKIEATLTEQTQALKTVLLNMSDGISLLDAELKVVVFNDRFLEMLGFPADRFQFGDPFEKFIRFNAERGEYGPGDIDDLVEHRVSLARQSQPHQFERTRPDGTVISIKGTPLPGGGFVSLYSDVTEEKRAEQQLIAAKETAETANRAKSDFLAHMSHELRTPLNSIIGFSQLLSSELSSRFAETDRFAYANDILSSGEHLLAIINDILDISKIEAAEFDLNESAFDLDDVIADAAKMVIGTVAGSDISLSYGRNPELPHLLADKRCVAQIVINLMSNAVKFNKPGGNVSVSAALDPQGGLEICVTDTGIGIAAEDMDAVLQPFSQIRRNAHLAIKGTGLGLSLSNKLTQLHGGKLTLESEIDRGTTVRVAFPKSRTVNP